MQSENRITTMRRMINMKQSIKRILAVIIIFMLFTSTMQTCNIAASSKSVKSKGVEYKALNDKKLTAKVIGSSRNISKAVVRDKIKTGKKI